MFLYPCVRYRVSDPDGTRRDIVISLTDKRLSWHGVPEILHPNSNERCYRQMCTSLVPEGTVKIREDALLDGYREEDYVLIDSNNNNVIVGEGIATANEAMALAREKMGLPGTTDGVAKVPKKEIPPDPFYWELLIHDAHPALPTKTASLIRTIVRKQANIVSASMPDYAGTDALWDLLDHGHAITNGSSDTAGEIPNDGSVSTLGHLLVLCKMAMELDDHWSQYAHLSVTHGEWVLKKSDGSLDKIVMLQAAGLDPNDKKAPATLAAMALGLLSTPIDFSGAPDDDFYL